jgi:hypothetical protein
MRTVFACLLVGLMADGQSVCNSINQLGDGISVQSALYVDGDLLYAFGSSSEGTKRLCARESGTGYFRRVITVREDKQFGYEVHVRRNASGKMFHVSVSPAPADAATLYFPRGPQPVDVNPGETVEFALFVLETRNGRSRLVERFMVHDGRDTAAGTKLNGGIQPLPPEGTPLNLVAPRLLRFGNKVREARKGSEIRGETIWFYLGNSSRIIISTVKKEGFDTTVPVRGSRLDFRLAEIDYSVESAEALIALPGEWVVWMKVERNWSPGSSSTTETAGFYMGTL